MTVEKKKKHVCSWQHVHLFDNFLRPLFHNPQKLFGRYVMPGMTVLDVGCGRGFASLGLAHLVGENGKVIAADLQPEMLEMVLARAKKARLSKQISTHRCDSDRIGAKGEFDFILAFWMIHEVPDTDEFLKEVFGLLKSGGVFFAVEPKGHVSNADFEQMIKRSQEIGFSIQAKPSIRFSKAVVMKKLG
ncbi:MAG: class I SAM-dependent methyltransferase [Pseudomonadota bacterium]